MSSESKVAVVVGATGGIGAALLQHLGTTGHYARVLGLARRPVIRNDGVIASGHIDVTDEASIAAAAAQAQALGTLRLVIVASGILHAPGIEPEKSWAALNAEAMARTFQLNTIGPALVAKHFLPMLPRRGWSVFAALSARVGSIEDNRLGGWHSYRASKAALNMMIRNFAVELARRAPEAICLGLHPGTVDTALSKPFQQHVAPEKLFSAARSAGHLLTVIDNAEIADSGRVLAWDGARIPA